MYDERIDVAPLPGAAGERDELNEEGEESEREQ